MKHFIFCLVLSFSAVCFAEFDFRPVDGSGMDLFDWNFDMAPVQKGGKSMGRDVGVENLVIPPSETTTTNKPIALPTTKSQELERSSERSAVEKSERSCKHKSSWADEECLKIMKATCDADGKKKVCRRFNKWLKKKEAFKNRMRNGSVKMAGFAKKDKSSHKNDNKNNCKGKEMWSDPKCSAKMTKKCSKGGKHQKVCQEFAEWKKAQWGGSDVHSRSASFNGFAPPSGGESKNWKFCKDPKNWRDSECKEKMAKKCSQGKSKKLCQQFEAFEKQSDKINDGDVLALLGEDSKASMTPWGDLARSGMAGFKEADDKGDKKGGDDKTKDGKNKKHGNKKNGGKKKSRKGGNKGGNKGRPWKPVEMAGFKAI